MYNSISLSALQFCSFFNVMHFNRASFAEIRSNKCVLSGFLVNMFPFSDYLFINLYVVLFICRDNP